MKTPLNRKLLFGQSARVAAWLLVTLIVLCFSNAPSAHAQSGGPGKSWGVVKSIDDMRLDIRNTNGRTETFTETDQTKWLNKKGQPIDAGDVVEKNVEVRWRWITGGSEALSVQLTSGSSRASGSSTSEGSRLRSGGGGSFAGTWRSDRHTVTITVNGDNATLDYSPGSPDRGTIRGNIIYSEGFSRRDLGSEVRLLKTNDSIQLSDDGMILHAFRTVFYPDGHNDSETETFRRVR